MTAGMSGLVMGQLPNVYVRMHYFPRMPPELVARAKRRAIALLEYQAEVDRCAWEVRQATALFRELKRERTKGAT